jgi:hypothetical protein
VTLVPTLVLMMYDKQQTPVFTPEQLRRLVQFFQQSINAEQVAVYDAYPSRDQGEALKILAEQYPKGLIRVGIQPDEKIGAPFMGAVQDTWSGFCHGKTNADWLDRGFGAETLRKWVENRNQQSHPVAWDLIVVAWDYSATERGGYLRPRSMGSDNTQCLWETGSEAPRWPNSRWPQFRDQALR